MGRGTLIQIKNPTPRLVPTAFQAGFLMLRDVGSTGLSIHVSAVSCASRVYVVDDDQAVRAAVSMLVEVSGWRPVPCASAEEFLDTYQPGVGQCLILDIRMPGLSGTELQARLRSRGDPVPVIMVSANDELREARQALADGALAVLAKPFDHHELLNWVAVALDEG